MAFSSKSSGRRQYGGGNTFSDINVTPMVDVMLVLLIVFMVAAPLMTVGVPVDLPKTQAAKMNDQIEPLIVSVDAQGRTFLKDAEMPLDQVVALLIQQSGNNPETKIYVRGDQQLAYGKVMEVMGAIAGAGFQKVSLIAELPTKNVNPAQHLKPSSSVGAPPQQARMSPAPAALSQPVAPTESVPPRPLRPR